MMLIAGPRKLDDKQIRRLLQKRNKTEFNFSYRSGTLDKKAMKRKGPKQFLLIVKFQKYKKNIKCQYPIKQLV